ncbi:MAG: hypothetical protein ACRC6I_01830 [Paracoccaceae bacterium]
MCVACENGAQTAANAHAAVLSDQLTNHGRKSHGRDAGGKAKQQGTEEAIAARRQAAWDRIYDETYRRLMKACKNK